MIHTSYMYTYCMQLIFSAYLSNIILTDAWLRKLRFHTEQQTENNLKVRCSNCTFFRNCVKILPEIGWIKCKKPRENALHMFRFSLVNINKSNVSNEETIDLEHLRSRMNRCVDNFRNNSQLVFTIRKIIGPIDFHCNIHEFSFAINTQHM